MERDSNAGDISFGKLLSLAKNNESSKRAALSTSIESKKIDKPKKIGHDVVEKIRRMKEKEKQQIEIDRKKSREKLLQARVEKHGGKVTKRIADAFKLPYVGPGHSFSSPAVIKSKSAQNDSRTRPEETSLTNTKDRDRKPTHSVSKMKCHKKTPSGQSSLDFQTLMEQAKQSRPIDLDALPSTSKTAKKTDRYDDEPSTEQLYSCEPVIKKRKKQSQTINNERLQLQDSVSKKTVQERAITKGKSQQSLPNIAQQRLPFKTASSSGAPRQMSQTSARKNGACERAQSAVAKRERLVEHSKIAPAVSNNGARPKYEGAQQPSLCTPPVKRKTPKISMSANAASGYTTKSPALTASFSAPKKGAQIQDPSPLMKYNSLTSKKPEGSRSQTGFVPEPLESRPKGLNPSDVKKVAKMSKISRVPGKAHFDSTHGSKKLAVPPAMHKRDVSRSSSGDSQRGGSGDSGGFVPEGIGGARIKRIPQYNEYAKQMKALEAADEESEEEVLSEADLDFIDDSEAPDVPPEYKDYSKHIKDIFGYDRNKYKNEGYFDDRKMEASFTEIMKEEAASARAGLLEDYMDYKSEKRKTKNWKNL